MTQTFSDLGLSAELVRAVTDEGYSTPTPVQQRAIPVVLSGRDVLVGAQTGTGKTAAFALPLLHMLTAAPGPKHIRALVLTPTRELAAQVEESVRAYARHVRIRSTMIFGGVGMNPQINALKRGVDIVVATPGRLLDHVQQKTIDLRHVEYFVLDEADRMLDMGFIHDIRRVLALLPAKRQNLLFSATFSEDIRKLASGLLHNPETIDVARRNADSELVTQRIYTVGQQQKRDLLAHLVSTGDWHQVLVFTRTKHGANRLAEQLTRKGIHSNAIHGNKSQSARMRALSGFKSGEVRVLVATDIAARGLDIEELPHVVNFDLPHVAEDYVHRIGRTGRAGSTGEALSLVAPEENGQLAAIERLLGRKIPRATAEGFVPSAAPATREGRTEEAQPGGERRQHKHQARRDDRSAGKSRRQDSRGGNKSRPHPASPHAQQRHERRTEQHTGDRYEREQPASAATQMFPSSGKVYGEPGRRHSAPRGKPRGRQPQPALLGGRRYED